MKNAQKRLNEQVGSLVDGLVTNYAHDARISQESAENQVKRALVRVVGHMDESFPKKSVATWRRFGTFGIRK